MGVTFNFIIYLFYVSLIMFHVSKLKYLSYIHAFIKMKMILVTGEFPSISHFTDLIVNQDD